MALLVWLAVRTWIVQGPVVPCRVLSGSMAPMFRGIHREVTCGDCGFRFSCDAAIVPLSPRAVCPNCGFADNLLEALPDVAGDGLAVGRTVFQLRLPQRWELVVFRNPNDARQLAVKRVVGLPGESLQIRDGEIYADGQMQRKDFAAQRSTAILVYDAAHQPANEWLPPRWLGEAKDTRWVGAHGRFARQATADTDPVDWLAYRHWRRLAERPGEVRETPVHDDYGYNQTVPRREEDSHVVGDLMLSFRVVETWGRGELAMKATDGREVFEVRLNPAEERYRVTHNGRAVPGAQGKFTGPLAGASVVVSLFDRQFVLAINDQPLFPPWAYDPSDRRLQPTPRPVAIGAQGLGIVLRDLHLYRDVYYTRPPGSDGGRGGDQPCRLGDQQYYLLGDNSPVSRDSRNWGAMPGVPLKLLVGKPLAVLYPMQSFRLLGRDFQVPDPGQIRYIR